MRFIRLFPELISINYEDRLKTLHIWSLEERRHRADLISMIHGFIDVPVSVFFELDADKRTRVRGHSMKLSEPIAVPISDYISFRHELSTAGTVCFKRPSMHVRPSVNAFKSVEETSRILASEENVFLRKHLVRITLIGCWLLMSQFDVR